MYRLDSGVRYRRLLDEAVLIHLQRAEAFVLNETALSFLELVDGVASLSEIVKQLSERFEADPSTLSSDLEPLIRQLRELRFLLKQDECES